MHCHDPPFTRESKAGPREVKSLASGSHSSWPRGWEGPSPRPPVLGGAPSAWQGPTRWAKTKDSSPHTSLGVLPVVLREGLLGGARALRPSWQPGISQMALGRVEGLSEDRVLFLLYRKSVSEGKLWIHLTSTPLHPWISE